MVTRAARVGHHRVDGSRVAESSARFRGGAAVRVGSDGFTPDGQTLLTTAPAGEVQRAVGLTMLASIPLVIAATLPFARQAFPGFEGVLPAYATALFLVELITGALLLGHFFAERRLAVLSLAAGYVFSATLVPAWALTFPGVLDVFGATSLDQATAYIAALRRVGFPLAVLLYAATRERPPLPAAWTWLRGLGTVCSAALAAFLLSWAIIGSDRLLPPLMRDARFVSSLWGVVPPVVIALYLAGLAALWRGRRSALDLWLMVVLGTLLADLVLLSYIGGGVRLSVGWWVGRAFGLVSASIVLVALLVETTSLHSRLGRSVAAERRARESRLTAMEALSATVAHEVAQPIASMVTNADAALRWLDKPQPEVGEARRALSRIVGDGHRAGEVVAGVRTLFGKGSPAHRPVDMRSLVTEMLARGRPEAEHARVKLLSETGPGELEVSGNAVQLGQAISNLLANAVEAARSTPGGPRSVVVRCARVPPGKITVSVEDTGPGIAAEHRQHIFEAFFTTRPDGMGMGLMFSRTIVEAHGGRLWVEDVAPHGAAFRFTLPAYEATADA